MFHDFWAFLRCWSSPGLSEFLHLVLGDGVFNLMGLAPLWLSSVGYARAYLLLSMALRTCWLLPSAPVHYGTLAQPVCFPVAGACRARPSHPARPWPQLTRRPRPAPRAPGPAHRRLSRSRFPFLRPCRVLLQPPSLRALHRSVAALLRLRFLVLTGGLCRSFSLTAIASC